MRVGSYADRLDDRLGVLGFHARYHLERFVLPYPSNVSRERVVLFVCRAARNASYRILGGNLTGV